MSQTVIQSKLSIHSSWKQSSTGTNCKTQSCVQIPWRHSRPPYRNTAHKTGALDLLPCIKAFWGFYTYQKQKQKTKSKNGRLFAQAKTKKCWFLHTNQNPKMLVSSHKPKPQNVGLFSQSKGQKCWSIVICMDFSFL